MALVPTASVYPSLVNISTDESGDLQEVTGALASKASANLYGTAIKVEALEAGGSGNDFSIEVNDNFGGTEDRVFYDAGTGEIVVSFAGAFTPANGGQQASVTYNNAFDITANAVGISGNLLQFSVIDNVTNNASGNDEVKVNASDNDISVCLVNDYSTYTNQDIYDLLTDNTRSWYSAVNSTVAIGTLSNGASVIVTGQFDLNGGIDPTGQSHTLTDVVNVINNDDDTSPIVIATGGGSTLPTVVSKVQFSGGADTIPSDLNPNAQYLCIDVADIHSLLTSEVNDARKIIWGMLETYVQFVTGQSVENQPENFLTVRGNPTLVIDQAGTRLRQTYTINAFYSVGDLDLEDETSV